MLRNEADRLKRVVVCTPSQAYFDATDTKEHNIAELADRRLAIQQHDNLKSTLTEFGCNVVDVPELDLHPNSVFTRDTAVCTPNGYIKLRLGLPTRQGEEEWMARILDSLDEECAGEITAPGTVEGGDVVLAGSVAFIGKGLRTNAEGVEQLSALLNDMNFEVRVIDLPVSVLHLDKALMVVGQRRLLCCPEQIPDRFTDGFEIIQITCDGIFDTNVVCLGENEVIVERSNHEAVNRLLAEGVSAHVLGLSEFAKGMGGPNCLVLPVDRWNEQPNIERPTPNKER